ncbi:MAG: GlsB/YeaQ/YmgE family stress response membrane protein, partial [Deltaproteobacteria bacterium]|nr:GlsB/YeaQ/YmgE family stress response membrane protein [Deltaproteobacteria bacterium]
AILIALLIGAIAGWLATLLVGQWSLGLVYNIIVGIFGGILASWLFPKLGISLGGGLLAAILAATLGATIILLVISTIRRIGNAPRRRL